MRQKGVDVPVEAATYLAEHIDEDLPVSIVQEDRLTVITPGSDMAEGAGEFKSERASHDQNLGLRHACLRKQPKQMLAPAYAHHAHFLRNPAVDDPKWWNDQFADRRLLKFRHDSTQFWVILERLYAMNGLSDQALADLSNALFAIPFANLDHVRDGGRGKIDLASHRSS